MTLAKKTLTSNDLDKLDAEVAEENELLTGQTSATGVSEAVDGLTDEELAEISEEEIEARRQEEIERKIQKEKEDNPIPNIYADSDSEKDKEAVEESNKSGVKRLSLTADSFGDQQEDASVDVSGALGAGAYVKYRKLNANVKELKQMLANVTELSTTYKNLASDMYDSAHGKVTPEMDRTFRPSVSTKGLEQAQKEPELLTDPEYDSKKASVIGGLSISLIGQMFQNVFGGSTAGLTKGAGATGLEQVTEYSAANLAEFAKFAKETEAKNQAIMEKHNDNLLLAYKEFDRDANQAEREYMQNKNKYIDRQARMYAKYLDQETAYKRMGVGLSKDITSVKTSTDRVNETNRRAIAIHNANIAHSINKASFNMKRAMEAKSINVIDQKKVEESIIAFGAAYGQSATSALSNSYRVVNAIPTEIKTKYSTIANKTATDLFNVVDTAPPERRRIIMENIMLLGQQGYTPVIVSQGKPTNVMNLLAKKWDYDPVRGELIIDSNTWTDTIKNGGIQLPGNDKNIGKALSAMVSISLADMSGKKMKARITEARVRATESKISSE